MSGSETTPVFDVVIIGCGDIAGGYDERGGNADAVLTHAGAYRAHPGFRVVACIDPDTKRRAAFMAHWSVADGFDDIAAFRTSAIPVDVASVCVPTPLHTTVLDALLQVPVRAVFCEKPISDDAQDSARLVGALSGQGKSVCVNYLRRFVPGLEQLRGEIQSGAWGGLQNAVGTYAKGVLNCGSHMVDMVRYLVGDIALQAVTMRRDDYSPTDPTLDAFFKTTNGAPIYFVGTDHRHFFNFELTLTFERGQVAIEDLGRSLRVRRGVKDPQFPDRVTLAVGETVATHLDKALVRAVDNLHDHLATAAPLVSDGQSAMITEQICHDMIDMSGV